MQRMWVSEGSRESDWICRRRAIAWGLSIGSFEDCRVGGVGS